MWLVFSTLNGMGLPDRKSISTISTVCLGCRRGPSYPGDTSCRFYLLTPTTVSTLEMMKLLGRFERGIHFIKIGEKRKLINLLLISNNIIAADRCLFGKCLFCWHLQGRIDKNKRIFFRSPFIKSG